MKDKKVAVVGAGLVGTLFTILLARRGYKVDVFERRGDFRKAEFVGGRSINLAMSIRGWKALEKAGIKDTIAKTAIAMPGRMMHSPEGGLAFQPYGEEGQAIYSVSRGGLNLELMKLASEMENVQFYFNEKCTGFDKKSKKITFKNAISKQTTQYDYPLIFGADGAFSALRYSLQKTPRFNYSQRYLDYGYKELSIPPTAEGDFAMDPNALHIWPRGNYMLIALPNHDRSFTCTLFMPFEGPVSFEQLQMPDQVQAFFNTNFSDAVPLMPTLLDDFHENPTSSLVTIRCNPWNFGHQVLLIGDASHAIVPFYGQGMNSGFEDCSILDELMEAFGDDWPKIVNSFVGSRPRDTDAIADLALRNFVEMRDLVGDPMFLLRKKIEAFLHQQYPKDFLPVYSMVTFSHTPYHVALLESHAQDELFRKIMAIDNIEQNWNSPEVCTVFEGWLAGR